MFIRFNKFSSENFSEASSRTLTLEAKDYPLSDQNATILRKETKADYVVTRGDVQLGPDSGRGSKGSGSDAGCALANVNSTESDIIQTWRNDPVTKATIDPLYPEDGKQFYGELQHVVDVQLARGKGVLPSDFNELSQGFTKPQSETTKHSKKSPRQSTENIPPPSNMRSSKRFIKVKRKRKREGNPLIWGSRVAVT